MNYRRVLLIFELSAEPGSAIAAVQRVAPHLEELILLAYAPGPRLPWMAGHTNEAAPLFEQLRHRAAGAAPKVEVKLASALDAGDLASLAAAASIDLLAVAEPKLAMLSAVAEVRKTLSLPLLCIWPAPSSDGPLKEILCVAIGSRAEGAVAAFLRDHGTPELHARVLTPRRPSSDELAIVLDVARIHAQVTLTPAQHPPDAPVDLVVLAQFPGPLLATRSWPAPILVLPPLQRSARPQRAIDVPDLVEDAGVFRARILYASGLGRHAPIPDQEVAFVAGGQVAALVATHKGDAEIRADLAADAVGVYRMAERKDLDPVSAIEERVRLIRPGSRPLILFDAALGARDVSLLAKHDGPEAPELLAVRMRPTRSCRAIRARLRRAGIRPCVIDASAVLDEGAALDVGKAMDVVRLARVVARMRGAAGFPVVAIVHGGAHAPSTAGFAALTADQLGSAAPWPVERRALPRSLEARLAETTGAALLAGNRVEIELDNPTARRWLLEAIRAARRRFHLQVYMAADDDVGSQVESALAEAGSRGVTVRVLVDSLHGLDGSFGARNPLLERLRTRPGVELRLVRSVTGLPSLEDLKRRDHRKIAIADGTLALLGGRNLSHEYYTGFDEVKLTAQSPWRQVPWLDAGARVEGPAVAVLERSLWTGWSVRSAARTWTSPQDTGKAR